MNKNILVGLLIIVMIIVVYIGSKTDRTFRNIDQSDVLTPITTGQDTIPPVNTGNTSPDMTSGNTVTGDDVNPNNGEGVIEGALSYPSERIPEDIYICAQDTTTKQEYCTSETLEDSKYTYGLGFKISVPEGEYYVYSSLESAAETNPSFKGWYSAMVACGLKTGCPTDLIAVKVSANQIVSDINPWDWYTIR